MKEKEKEKKRGVRPPSKKEKNKMIYKILLIITIISVALVPEFWWVGMNKLEVLGYIIAVMAWIGLLINKILGE